MKVKIGNILGIMAVVGMIALALTGCPEPDPVHNHTWGAWQSNATEHWKECTAGDGAKTDVGNHTGDPCTVCGYDSTTPDPNHTHTYAAAWTHDATQHWKECTAGDGAKTDVAPHDWGGWQDTTPATITAEGEATRTCTTCGKTETKTVDKLLACTCLTTYGTTAHLGIDANGNVVACTCGGTNCSNCTEQTATVSDTTIPIRKVVNVSVKQMNDTVDNLRTEYDYLNETEKGKFTAKVNKIYITSGSNINLDEAGILNIGCDTDIGVIMDYIFDNIM